MRFVRVVFICVIVSVVAVAASVTYITQVLDPNDLKPTLVNSAKKQQVRLELQGNITWAFWPWFGISVEKVRASSALLKASIAASDVILGFFLAITVLTP